MGRDPTRTDPRLEVSSHYCTTLTGNCCRRVPRRAAPAPCRMYNFTPRELFTSRGIIWPFITARRINFDGEMVIILPHSSSSHAHNKSPPFSAVFSLSLSLMLICSHLPISAVRSWSRSHGRVLAADEEREGSREGHACFLHIPSGRCGSKVKTRHLVPISRVKWALHGVRPRPPIPASPPSLSARSLPSRMESFLARSRAILTWRCQNLRVNATGWKAEK